MTTNWRKAKWSCRVPWKQKRLRNSFHFQRQSNKSWGSSVAIQVGLLLCRFVQESSSLLTFCDSFVQLKGQSLQGANCGDKAHFGGWRHFCYSKTQKSGWIGQPNYTKRFEHHQLCQMHAWHEVGYGEWKRQD